MSKVKHKPASDASVGVEALVIPLCRIIVWFSCGACSTLTLKKSIEKYGDRVIAVYCDTGGEHPDNKRFLSDVEKWLNIKVIILKNKKYKDHFDVYEKTKFLISPNGARCTVELKKKLRFEFQKPDDLQIFGYSADEQHRAKRFNESFPEVKTEFPLIDLGISKQQAIGYLWKNNMDLPTMYKLGYNNNNCIGCVKGGKGYWNKIRKDFPKQFEQMSKIERELGIKMNDKFLDEMGENEGNHKNENISCDFTCQSI